LFDDSIGLELGGDGLEDFGVFRFFAFADEIAGGEEAVGQGVLG
jgi:hypothetical protein